MWVRLIVAGIIGIATLVVVRGVGANEAPPPGRGPGPSGHEAMRGPFERSGPRDFREWNEAEWQQCASFLRAHSPNRWKAFERLELGDRQRRGFQWLLITRWRQLEQIKEDRELYEVKVGEVEAEDAVFGFVSAAGADQPVAEQHREKVREAVARLLELRLKERELRIVRARKALEAEEQRLSDDRRRHAERIEEWLARAMKGEIEWLRPGQGFRRPPATRPTDDGPRP